ncbi:PP2C family protein-serine/threonine phosphatase [Streptomyces sp. 8K308]|uniref:PP2C family protein-serine/threonine phosphatase n=1 Tax=Streptomyces sp. 8K308 TaxID=2530388 RepID=UPI001FB713B3|nr:PP2C family protein-serine/threonine phosphatase [Streptomyces sp. 8K308]
MPAPGSAPPLGLGTGARQPDTYLCATDLPPGAFLLLYTDGVTEARAPHGSFYDPSISLRDRVFDDPDTLVDAVIDDVLAHTGGNLHDDTASWPATIQRALRGQETRPGSLPSRRGAGSPDEKMLTGRPQRDDDTGSTVKGLGFDRLINTSHQVIMNGPSYRPDKHPTLETAGGRGSPTPTWSPWKGPPVAGRGHSTYPRRGIRSECLALRTVAWPWPAVTASNA